MKWNARQQKPFCVLAAMAFMTLPSCVPQKTHYLQLGGSTTGNYVMELLLEDFQSKHPLYSVSYESLGSSIGIRNVLSEIWLLGVSSRPLYPEEAAQEGIIVEPLAIDAIIFLIHRGVPLSDITIDQLTALLGGKTRNWDALTRLDAPVTIFTRDEASGTRGSVQTAILQEEPFRLDSIVVTSSEDMIHKVSSTPYSLGYSDISHIQNIVEARVLSLEGVFPKEKAILEGHYPVRRHLYLVYSHRAAQENEHLQLFLEYLHNDTEVEPLIRAAGLLVPSS